MLLNSVYALQLQSAITGFLDILNGFAADPLFAERFELVFGKSISSSAFQAALASLPQFEVRSDGDLAGALGAFSAQTQKIYLTESLLTGDPARLQAVMIEEIGHFLDAQVNTTDTAGDEGELFSDLVRGVSLSAAELGRIQAEDDHAVVMIDGQEVAIEMATNVFSNLFATGDAFPKNFVIVGKKFYFTVNNGNNGTALWTIDSTGILPGTPGTPVFIKNFGPEVNGRQLRNLTAGKDTAGKDILYFVAYDSTNGTAIWKSDGTSGGTVLVDAVYKSMGLDLSYDLPIENLTAVGSDLYFTAYNSDGSGYELSKLGGGVKDNSGNSFRELTDVNGTLSYVKDSQLWQIINDNPPEFISTNGTPYNLANINNQLWFATTSSPYTRSPLVKVGSDLYFTLFDGTNYQLFRNSNPVGNAIPLITNLTNVNGKLYFTANDGISGNELWKFDDTTNVLSQVEDIYLDAPSSNPNSLTSVGNTLYFTAEDGVHGYGLWKTETGNGDKTTFVHRIYRDFLPPKSWPLSNLLLNFNGTLYFAGDGDAVHGAELWTSDSTASGTNLVTDINSNFFTGTDNLFRSYSVHPQSVVSNNNILYFTAHIVNLNNPNGYDIQLWQSDGTTTKPVLDAKGNRVLNPSNLTDVNDKLYFSGYDATGDNELWTINTFGFAARFKDINFGGSSNPRNLKNVGGTLYFSADDGSSGTEPWISQGTPDSTIILKDIVTPNDFDSGSNPTNFTNAGGKSYFTTFNQLWESDGTAAGTNSVLNNSGKPITAYNLTGFGTSLYYVAFDAATSGYQLWKHDFGAIGASSVTRLTERVGGAGIVGMNPSTYTTVSTFNLTNVGGVAYFAATNGIDGYELWTSNGTVSGTKMVPKNINLTGSSLPQNLIDVSGVLYFTADDGGSGRELWTSDGTEAGTYLVEDINKIGNSSSSIANLTNVNGTLYFTADDGINGVKIWQVVPDSSRVGKMTAIVADNALFPSDLINYQNRLFFTGADLDGQGRGLQTLGPSISLQGSKWNDLNGNGTWDTGEQALSGWTIYIDGNKNGQFDTGELSTVTNANGQYTFTNLTAGQYTIGEIAQTGWEQTYPNTSYSINLKTGAITGSPNPFITLLSSPTDSNGDGYLEALVKLNYQGALDKVKFIIDYDKLPTGWTVDIGDSVSNNGYGGDSGNTSNAAETEILETGLNLYSNTLPGYQNVVSSGITISNLSNFVKSGSQVILEVSNERLDWNNQQGLTGSFTSPYLYTLNGQATTYGPVDYDLYASFNRVIAGGRYGAGASKITIVPVNTGTQTVNLSAGQTLTNINFGNRQVNQNLLITPQKDIIDALDGDDTVTGTFANLQQQDSIKGGTGIDTLVITEGTTSNAVTINASNTTNQFNITGTTINGFERFDLSGFLGKVAYTGTTANDWVATGVGADVLNGNTGVDTLIGGTGNDTYTVDNVSDIVTETSTFSTEIDTVNSSVTYTLSANVERLTLTGTANINGTGNTLANTITGNTGNNILDGGDGNDILNGGVGIDTLIGGLGNDTYTVDNGGDIVTETSTLATEIDTVNSSITYILGLAE